jgi:hypothetical protein
VCICYKKAYEIFERACQAETAVNNCPMSPEAEREAARANVEAAKIALFFIADEMERHGVWVPCALAPKCSITGNFF